LTLVLSGNAGLGYGQSEIVHEPDLILTAVLDDGIGGARAQLHVRIRREVIHHGAIGADVEIDQLGANCWRARRICQVPDGEKVDAGFARGL
jgi:hypothetical protein